MKAPVRRDPLAGQAHPNARLTDHEAELVLELHAQGMGYDRLGVIFEVHKSCIAKICRGERRSLVLKDEAVLRPKRVCSDALPQMPPIDPEQCAGVRAMTLMAAALSVAPER